MAVQYTNRVGKTYDLRKGKTRTGKPRYFFSTQQEGKGEAVDRIPDGYEIYEHPENAQVFLRKIRPQLISDLEEHLVRKAVNSLERTNRYIVDCKDEYITVYESSTNFGELKSFLADFMAFAPRRPGTTREDAMNAALNTADGHYMAMLRFRLVDPKQRTFAPERYCFRGAIDDWIHLGPPGNLDTLVESYVELLGTDDFYNAPYLL